MKYKTQMDCSNRNGKYSKGTKVTGMSYYIKKGIRESLSMRRKANSIHAQLLVSTNDSRIRLCQLDDYSQLFKYKGLSNTTMQIKSSFSDDCKFIISGSDDGHVFIWNTLPDLSSKVSFFATKKDRVDDYESFDAGSTAVGSLTGSHVATTVGIFAPATVMRVFLELNSHKVSLDNNDLTQLQSQLQTQTQLQDEQVNSKHSGDEITNSLRSSTNSNGRPKSWTKPNSGKPSDKASNSPNSSTHNSFDLKKLPANAASFYREQFNQVTNENEQLQSDLCTRLIFTADCNGIIKVFLRLH